MNSEQHSLTTFKGQTQQQPESTDSSSTSSSKSTPNRDTPGIINSNRNIDALYEDVADRAAELPEELREHSVTTPVSPPSTGIATDPELPPLPISVGNWKLATRGKKHVIYASDGKAISSDYGNGGAIHRIRLFLNDFGYNKNYKYQRKAETVVGYTNGHKIRNASIDSTGVLTNIPGHDVMKNTGDRSTAYPCEYESETFYEAIVDLLVHLHFTPTPVQNYVDHDPDTKWELVTLRPRYVQWKAQAPSEFKKDELKLSLKPESVTLRALNKDENLPEAISTPVPTFDTPKLESMCEHTESRTNLPAMSAGVVLCNNILSQNPNAVTASTDI